MRIRLTKATHYRGRWRSRGGTCECGRTEGEALIRLRVAEPVGCRGGFAADGPVCVVVATFNRVELLCETIRSVLVSEPRPDRLVVVDLGSADGTPDFLEEIAAIHFDLIEVLRRPEAGAAAADLPSDAIVVELDEGDLLERGALAAMAEAIRRDGRAFVYGDCVMIDDTGRAKRTLRRAPYVPWQFRRKGCPNAGARAYPKGLLDAAGVCGAAFGADGARDLCLRFERALGGRGIEALGQILSRVRVSPGAPAGHAAPGGAGKPGRPGELAISGRAMPAAQMTGARP